MRRMLSSLFLFLLYDKPSLDILEEEKTFISKDFKIQFVLLLRGMALSKITKIEAENYFYTLQCGKIFMNPLPLF